MKIIKILVKTSTIIGLLLLATLGSAATQSTVYKTQGTGYIGADLGLTALALPGGDFSTEWMAHLNSDNKGTYNENGGASLHIDGGYLFNIGNSKKFQVGPELGYTSYSDVGEYKLSEDGGHAKMTYSGHYFDVLAKGQYNFNPMWSMYAKLGLAFVTQKRDLSGNMPSITDRSSGNVTTFTSATATKTLPEVGFGGSLNFNPHFGINADITALTGDTVKVKDVYDLDPKTGKAAPNGGNKVASVMSISFGAHYNF